MDDQQDSNDIDVKTTPQINYASGKQEDKNQAIILMNLEDLIKSNISSINRLKKDMSEQKAMLDGALEGDATYKEFSDKVKEVSKQRSEVRAQIMKQPSMVTLVNKVKDMKAEIKEREVSLTDYLQEYVRLANTDQIEDENGEILKIVNYPKLVRQSSMK